MLTFDDMEIVKEIKELEEILLQHCYDMDILNIKSPIKKSDSILDSLVSAVVRSEMSICDIKKCIDDVNIDIVVDLKFFEEGGNINDFIDDRWIRFAKALWRQRSVGLGTPNAASGEGELMFIFLSKHIKKPTKGDLSINGEDIELKGSDVRVMGNISGKRFREETLKISMKYGLKHNISNKTNLKSVELEKDSQFKKHWKKELGVLCIDDQKKFIKEWLSVISSGSSIGNIFSSGEFNHIEFKKQLVKLLYSVNLKDRKFDKFVLLGDGTNSKIIGGDVESFNEKIDNGEIKILSDYFRVNQSANIGWYIY
jgi:hypothetical protein